MAGARNSISRSHNNLRVVSTQQTARNGKKKKFLRIVLLGLLSAFLFSVSAFYIVKGVRLVRKNFSSYLLESDFFRVAAINVKISPEIRPVYLTQDHFLEYLNIEEGISMFALNPLKVSAQLQNHPWVKEAQVRRIFPNKLMLSVVVRHPVALINAKSLYYVDSQGDIFKTVNAQESKDFPLISGISLQTFQRHPQNVHQGILQAVELLQMIQEKFPVLTARGEISEIKLEPVFPFQHVEQFGLEQEWDLSLVLNPSGAFVRLGSDGYEEKLLRLLKLVQNPEQHVQVDMPLVFDLRFANQIVVQPLMPARMDTI